MAQRRKRYHFPRAFSRGRRDLAELLETVIRLREEGWSDSSAARRGTYSYEMDFARQELLDHVAPHEHFNYTDCMDREWLVVRMHYENHDTVVIRPYTYRRKDEMTAMAKEEIRRLEDLLVPEDGEDW